MAGYYLIHSIDFWEKINLSHESSADLFLYISVAMYLAAPNERREPRRRGRRQPDILAKDLTGTRIILTLYFTIFLNQLDILCA
jgi:hypothetical protein